MKDFTHRTTVGNNSAENTKIASKEFMTENFPTIAKIIRPATNPTEDSNIRKRNAVYKDFQKRNFNCPCLQSFWRSWKTTYRLHDLVRVQLAFFDPKRNEEHIKVSPSCHELCELLEIQMKSTRSVNGIPARGHRGGEQVIPQRFGQAPYHHFDIEKGTLF